MHKTTSVASDDDTSGIDTLVTLLLSKIDNVNETTEASLDDRLKNHNIYDLLEKFEASIRATFEEAVTPTNNRHCRRLLMPKRNMLLPTQRAKRRTNGYYRGNTTGIMYHAYKLKLDHREALDEELDSIRKENDARKMELRELWKNWGKRVDELEGILEKMDELGSEKT